MNAHEVRTLVDNVLREVQIISGREYTQLGMSDSPLGKLDGFDSLIGIEATVMLEECIGREIPRDSLFISEDGRRASTLSEICEYLTRFDRPLFLQYRTAA